jgi:hypothetical protein
MVSTYTCQRERWNLKGPNRRRIRYALLSYVSCAAVIAQQADQTGLPSRQFVATPGQSFYLDLDSAAGTFSQWRHDDLGSLNSMHAVVRMLRKRRDATWSPSFSIALQGEDSQGGKNRLGLQAASPDGKLPLKIRLTGDLDGKQIQEIPLSTTINLNEDLKVEMTWGTQKAVTIKVGEAETRVVNIAWQVRSVVVAGSTGQVKVDPIVFGIVPP